MRGCRTRALGCLLALAAWPAPADVVYLNQNQALRGVVVHETTGEIVLKQFMSEMTLHKDKILRVEKEDNGPILYRYAEDALRQNRWSLTEEYARMALERGYDQNRVRALLVKMKAQRDLHMESLLDRQLLNATELLRAGKRDSALETLNRFEKTYGTHPRLRALRGEILCHMAVDEMNHLEYTQAYTLLEQAREDSAPAGTLHQVLGMLQAKEGRVTMARYEFALARQFKNKQRPDPLLPPLPELPAEVVVKVAPPPARPVGPKDKETVVELIARYAQLRKLDATLVEAVVRAESNYRADAVSPVGAVGLMQLMPGTARDLKVKNSYDPEDNIAGGTLYLRQMLDQFDNNHELALAAYNAGPGAVKFYKGIPPYRETQNYVKKVLREREKIRAEKVTKI